MKLPDTRAGRVHCKLDRLGDAADVLIPTNANSESRHDGIAACEFHSNLVDPPGDTY